jgi:hypothetical protein
LRRLDLADLALERRFMAPPLPGTGIVAGQTVALEAAGQGPWVGQSSNVRLGSQADIGECPHHVRFTPKSGHRWPRW